MESWMMAVNLVRRHAGSWSYIQGSTHNCENEGKTYNLEWIQYTVYAVFGVCCIWCMLYLVYAVHSVNLWSWHGEIERDYSTLCSAIMVELWNRKRGGGWRWQQYGGYEQIWEISSTTCLIGFGRPRIRVMTCCIQTYTCRIGYRKLTRTWHSPSPSFSWWFPPSPPISLFLILNATTT
jgi:hypothetical protein